MGVTASCKLWGAWNARTGQARAFGSCRIKGSRRAPSRLLLRASRPSRRGKRGAPIDMHAASCCPSRSLRLGMYDLQRRPRARDLRSQEW